MAITLVGTPVVVTTLNGATATITWPAETQAGDLAVVIAGRFWRSGVTHAPSTTGYTERHLRNTAQPAMGAWSKFMGSTPDATAVIPSTANTADGMSTVGLMLRGVDPTTPLDVTVAASATRDPPAVTTATNGAWVVTVVGSSVNDTSPGTFGGSWTTTASRGVDTNTVTMLVGYLEQATAGSVDPPDPTSLTSTTPYSFTLALRPAAAGAVQHPVSGTVAASSTAFATVTARLGVAGMAAATSTATGSPKALLGVAGTAPATSTAFASPTARLGVSGSVPATTDTFGTVARGLPVSGTAEATVDMFGTVTGRYAVDGMVAATSDALGTVGARLAVAGAAPAITAAFGSVDLVGGPVAHPVSGAVNVISGAFGTVGARRAVEGLAAATSGTYAALTALLGVSGTVEAVAALVGSVEKVEGGEVVDAEVALAVTLLVTALRVEVARTAPRVGVARAEGLEVAL